APHLAPPITLAVGIAVAEAAREFGAPAELKWPNDVLVAGKKVAGILTEMCTRDGRLDHLVVGIGVNLYVLRFPDALVDRVTSLAIAIGHETDRPAFAAKLCERLEAWHDVLVAEGPAPVVAGWKRFAPFFGQRVTVSSGKERLVGVAEDLEP